MGFEWRNQSGQALGTARLAGPEGIIAQWVRSQAGLGAEVWTLEARVLNRLGGRPDGTWIAFVSGDGPEIRLERLIGQSHGDRTDIVLHFAEAGHETAGRTLVESLALAGGTSAGSHSWAWTAPAMEIGGGVFSPRRG